jgi:preprotein translocase subunit SecD
MFAISRLKAWCIILICSMGILFCIPNFLDEKMLSNWPSWLQHKVNLGLELQGGSHLQFEVDFHAVEKEYLSNLLTDVRGTLRKNHVGYKDLKIKQINAAPVLSFTLIHPEKDSDLVRGLLTKTEKDFHIDINNQGTVLAKIEEEQNAQRKKKIVEQSVEVIRKRIDESGTKEPTILPQSDTRIVVQLPGVSDPSEVKRLIGKTAKLSFRLVTNAPISRDGKKPLLPSNQQWLTLHEKEGAESSMVIGVEKEARLTGDQLIDAQVITNTDGKGPGVSLRFNKIGAKRFAQLSTDNLQKSLAIVLDNMVISAPVLSVPILDGSGHISGNFTLASANELAVLLRAGALPAPLKIVEERTVGPSLGADSIHDGKRATVIAFILVGTFMILGYSLFGFFANIALSFNLILLFAGLSLLGATLTLPGIAGIAMTIGMAVDANVLIYERIKEEFKKGLRPHLAIEAGYNRAMSTIIDSNLTTLIGAAALFQFGSGSIRGFAVTLALGIMISMFTALSVTKLITAWWFRTKPSMKTLPI